MINKTTSLIIQIIVWTALFVFFLVMGMQFNSIQTASFRAGMNIIMLVLLTYINSTFLVPKLFNSKLILLYFLSVIGLILLYIFVSKEVVFSNYADIKITIFNKKSGQKKITDGWILFQLVTLVFSTGALFASSVFALMKEMYLQNKKTMKLEIDKKASELKLLKTQFSPHFFLNSLNNLYSISKLNPNKTAGFIERLTSLMQYITYEQKEDKVSIEKEINFIKDYIYFQKEKGDNLYEVTTDFSNTDMSLLIEPRLLISFVENAFKHAYNPTKKMNINIKMFSDKDKFYFAVVNDISTYEQRKKETGYFGVGINSVTELLKGLYPEKHELKISNTDQEYTVQLIINLNDA